MSSIKYRKLDSSGDYSFGFGNANFYTDADAVSQAIETKLNLLEGEWWGDITDGLPFFQEIAGQLGTADSLIAINLIVQNRILDAPNIKEITTFSSTYESRKYSFSATVETDFGTVEVSS